MEKLKIIILRGLPGSGKSTWVKNNFPNALVCSADNYFNVGGVYKFDGSKLGKAHAKCQADYLNALVCPGPRVVVVDNTNLVNKDFAFYMDHGLKVTDDLHIVTLNVDIQTSAARNVHGVPMASIERMAKRMEPVKAEWSEFECDQTCFQP